MANLQEYITAVEAGQGDTWQIAEELMDELISKYPTLLTDVKCGAFCPPGWLSLVDTLCERILALEAEAPGCKVVVEQVKEKFGGLRFYTSTILGGDADAMIDFDVKVNVLVSQFEVLSEHTCQVCGLGGELGGTGWLSTKCKQHRN